MVGLAVFLSLLFGQPEPSLPPPPLLGEVVGRIGNPWAPAPGIVGPLGQGWVSYPSAGVWFGVSWWVG